MVFVVALLLSGCSDDLDRTVLFHEGAGEICLPYSIEKANSTRSSFEGESAIDHAYLLFYPADASLNSDSPSAAVRADASEGNLKFKVPLILEENTQYNILAVANADYFVPDGFSSYAAYLESLFVGSGVGDPAGIELVHPLPLLTSSISHLPMRGEITGNSNFSFSISNGLYSLSHDLSLTFSRLVARVDVINNASGVFKLDGIAICNWRDAVSVIDPDSNAGEVCGILSQEGFELEDDDFISLPDPSDMGILQLMAQLYCFPSQSFDSRQDDTSTTALILKGRYGEDSESCYYRINVGSGDYLGKVKANTKYTVAIASVSGRGASSPLEAYSSSESLVSLSVVEDWDVDGTYAKDDDGNFIIVSRSALDFASGQGEVQTLRLLTSTGLSWQAEYIPSDEASADAFIVEKLSDSVVSVKTAAVNESDAPFSGKCRISASTQGEPLVVDVILRQNPGGGMIVDPWLPDVALVPVIDNDERVKIDYENHTIEIDGFDPKAFNSFIDFSFKAHLSDRFGPEAVLEVCLDVDAPLAWPLEGRISKDPSHGYRYAVQSFYDTAYSQVWSDVANDNVHCNTLYNSSLSLKNEDEFYISVGAMAPDDPAIVRIIILKVKEAGTQEPINYTLTIKPRPVIIDDVILTDDSGVSWVVMDRNLEDMPKYADMAGRDSDGRRSQAYHYCGYNAMKIPFKSGNEQLHPEREGKKLQLNMGYTLWWQNVDYSLTNWLEKYKYKTGDIVTSPFYNDNINKYWNLPAKELLELCASRMCVSKMRMFLVSEYPVIKDNIEYPVCCYFPYSSNQLESTAANGYMSFNVTKDEVDAITVIYATSLGVESKEFTSPTYQTREGVVRLVHKLDSESLSNYLNEYLGYGDKQTNLLPCHPDISEKW